MPDCAARYGTVRIRRCIHSHTRASQSHMHDTIETLSLQIENAFTPHIAAPPSK